MDEIIQRVKALDSSAKPQVLKGYSEDYTFWRINVDLPIQFKFFKKHLGQVLRAGGLLYSCNSYHPPIIIEGLASMTKSEIEKFIAVEVIIDIVYLPVIPKLCKDIIAMAYDIAGLRLDYGDRTEDVLKFLKNLSKICTFLPYSVESDSIFGKIFNVLDMKIFKQFVQDEYIPLLLSLGKLEFSPEEIKTDTIRSMELMI